MKFKLNANSNENESNNAAWEDTYAGNAKCSSHRFPRLRFCSCFRINVITLFFRFEKHNIIVAGTLSKNLAEFVTVSRARGGKLSFGELLFTNFANKRKNKKAFGSAYFVFINYDLITAWSTQPSLPKFELLFTLQIWPAHQRFGKICFRQLPTFHCFGCWKKMFKRGGQCAFKIC